MQNYCNIQQFLITLEKVRLYFQISALRTIKIKHDTEQHVNNSCHCFIVFNISHDDDEKEVNEQGNRANILG